MWVKICGNTNLEDCLLAAELGADAVGFVFAAGKRTVTAAQIAPIVAQLPARTEKIGVFTTGDHDAIVAVVAEAGLTGVQLHGALDFTLLQRLRAYFEKEKGHGSLIQVVPWWTDLAPAQQQEAFAAEARKIVEDGSANAILIDSRTREASGGTGHVFDWHAAKTALHGLDHRVIVAGGLTPDNVGEAIQVLLPWGVDVSSGIELAPGRKDPRKLAHFVKRAKAR